MNRLYNSISLANWLLTRNITCVGTLNNNRIDIPGELMDAKKRDVFSITLHYEKDDKNIALCTYTVKTKSSGKKNVKLLSTMRPLPGITKDDKKQQPAIFK